VVSRAKIWEGKRAYQSSPLQNLVRTRPHCPLKFVPCACTVVLYSQPVIRELFMLFSVFVFHDNLKENLKRTQ